MNSFIAFTKKEFMEQLRTYKILIMFSVYFIFGIMSPLMAKLLPDVLMNFAGEGIAFIIPEPTNIDAYAQFFKNTTQMGMIVLLLVFGGTISNELTKGTLVNILAKGLPRRTVILSKYIAAVVLWSLSYFLAALTTYGYTVYLFEKEPLPNLIFSLFCLWLFGAFVISLIFLSSILTGGSFGGLILSAVILGVCMVANLFPQVKKINPITLASENLSLLTGNQTVGVLSKNVWVTITLIVLSLLVSVLMFGKKKL